MQERLGYLIRGFRFLVGDGVTYQSKVTVDSESLLRVLNAADSGLYLCEHMPRKVGEIEKQLDQAKSDAQQVLNELTASREAYIKDLNRAKAMGFEDIDEMIYYAEQCHEAGHKVGPKIDDLPH